MLVPEPLATVPAADSAAQESRTPRRSNTNSLPEESVALRSELQRTIDMRVYELVAFLDRNYELRQTAGTYRGNWRDVVLLLCALLFTLVWWNVPHDRTNWLITFIVLVIVSVVIGLYAARGVIAALRRLFDRR